MKSVPFPGLSTWRRGRFLRPPFPGEETTQHPATPQDLPGLREKNCIRTESKKPRWPFSKRGVQGKDKNKHISDLEDCLSSLKITDFRDYEFHTLKDKTWSEVMEMHQKLPTNQSDLRKQQEAVWELFTSECTYFLDHLLVLKMIFMNTLKYLQTHEYLLDVDLWRLFANLEELSQTSFGFVNSLLRIFKDYVDICETSPSLDFISVLTKYFRGSLCQSHQTYCLNYSAAVFYLESLKQRHDFGIYLKWCEQNDQCRRLHLPELLVAPLHRLTRYPLLLKNIWKRSTDSTEKIMIYSIKEKVEKSIRDLEGKVKWLDNFQKFRHLQEIVVWPPLWDRDKRFFIPECLKHIFKEHMAENILSPTNRHLLYEGKLTLAESTRFLDVYLFLFDDFLLVTKTKRNKKKLGGSDPGLMCPSLTPELQTVIKEGGSCTVIDQPIPLDRLVVRGLEPLHVSAFPENQTLCKCLGVTKMESSEQRKINTSYQESPGSPRDLKDVLADVVLCGRQQCSKGSRPLSALGTGS
uniref:DH domain-containing protein n=1 Tax=Capra hircus TaxID=9925 RepID=A0A8C2RJS8_CAPHI